MMASGRHKKVRAAWGTVGRDGGTGRESADTIGTFTGDQATHEDGLPDLSQA